ncbi:virulence factor family protein [Aureimonas leprariae]|uniref:Virulence factor family protein n=1 Tax=Plantimonas leprariae TaxID=2615207 RepID=A0A7V7PPK2_9HYPH|nr:AcvB/VirJ family lysyl-phosphatidylglycerol hydrolase [Aureimonas leprariae]KAB0679973.1 virulence factor family protein [Aureimonas leprariae]
MSATKTAAAASILLAATLLAAAPSFAQSPPPPTPAPAASAPQPAEEDEGHTAEITLPDGSKQTVHTGMIPGARISVPTGGNIAAEVVLISDSDGWNDDEDDLAATFLDQDAVVIGIDLPSYLAELEKAGDDCVYLVSDIEALGQEVQRAAKDDSLSLPILAGIGAGGSLALSILAQTPDNTIQATVAVDPEGGITLKKDLCTGAKREDRHGRAYYGLEDRALPDPATVIFTPDADKEGRNHVAALADQADGIDIRETDDDDAFSQLGLAVGDLIEQATETDPDTAGLPLTILDAKPTRDTLAIIYSGDGGWRDLDKEIGDIFQKEGLPTVGVDSLRYFWTKQTPEKVASDLTGMIDRFRKRWGVRNVLLIGYSFGADILPAAYDRLPQAQKDSVAMVSLLAFSATGDYQVSVAGWLGVDNGGDTNGVKDAEAIDPKLIQCVYGTEDEDDACKQLKDRGVEMLGIAGGHHFDEDYPALAAKIVASLDRRLKPEAASNKP